MDGLRPYFESILNGIAEPALGYGEPDPKHHKPTPLKLPASRRTTRLSGDPSDPKNNPN
jgi:hypothetical protein